eukprot:1157619-Pelagomonas_calceolata.AAC.30
MPCSCCFRNTHMQHDSCKPSLKIPPCVQSIPGQLLPLLPAPAAYAGQICVPDRAGCDSAQRHWLGLCVLGRDEGAAGVCSC